MAAQNQHYVPKFILRQFLSDEGKERVAVYDKQADRAFVTSIKNVMAERRFNDFVFEDDWIVSFEPIASGTEEMILPAYRQVLEDRRLSNDPHQKAALALLLAFQFLRTKAHRDRWKGLQDQLQAHIQSLGGRMEDVEGWEDWKPASEDQLKREHLVAIRHSLTEFTHIMAAKDFVLAEASPGRSFYLGDNPVSLHNRRDFGPYGNLGLAVPGIEIYLPLSANLMLCAWCPSILAEIRQTHEEGKKERRSEALARVLSGTLSAMQMKGLLDSIRPMEDQTEDFLSAAAEGRPLSQDSDNMDFYNSLQTQFASRYIVCQIADFDLARRYNREFPEFRSGVQPRFN